MSNVKCQMNMSVHMRLKFWTGKCSEVAWRQRMTVRRWCRMTLLHVVRSGVQHYNRLTVFMARRRGTWCHSACCWSNVAPSTAVCIVIRSCGASNTSFITYRQEPCGCWTMCMEHFTSVRHRLLVTSHLQEISQEPLLTIGISARENL